MLSLNQNSSQDLILRFKLNLQTNLLLISLLISYCQIEYLKIKSYYSLILNTLVFYKNFICKNLIYFLLQAIKKKLFID